MVTDRPAARPLLLFSSVRTPASASFPAFPLTLASIRKRRSRNNPIPPSRLLLSAPITKAFFADGPHQIKPVDPSISPCGRLERPVRRRAARFPSLAGRVLADAAGPPSECRCSALRCHHHSPLQSLLFFWNHLAPVPFVSQQRRWNAWPDLGQIGRGPDMIRPSPTSKPPV